MTSPKPRKPPRKTSSRGTGPRTLGAAPGAAAAPGTGRGHFTAPHEIRAGAALYDREHDMPGRARRLVDGRFVELERPTGFVWRVHFSRLRPATDHEVRQLAALARLHRLRLRGLAGA